LDWEVENMAISNETLRGIIQEYHGFEMSDGELELVRPELENYLAAVAQLRDLDLSGLMSGRLLRGSEGGGPRAQQ
jgi:hypothetical protein